MLFVHNINIYYFYQSSFQKILWYKQIQSKIFRPAYIANDIELSSKKCTNAVFKIPKFTNESSKTRDFGNGRAQYWPRVPDVTYFSHKKKIYSYLILLYNWFFFTVRKIYTHVPFYMTIWTNQIRRFIKKIIEYFSTHYTYTCMKNT